MVSVPFEVQQQIIQCFGRCFHYKKTVVNFMRTCDVPEKLITEGMDLPKFVWVKNILDKLNLSDDGRIVIRKIATEFNKMRDIPFEVEKRSEGLDALRKLKILVKENSLVVDPSKGNQTYHQLQKDLEVKQLQDKSRAMTDLRTIYFNQFSNKNVQNRGYELEKIISKLFNINRISFQGSYRNKENTQQIDGFFRFEGFDYLVEAKWETGFINSAKIASLKQKVDTKLISTRGLFISINGFRDEVIQDYSNRDAKIIFMDGRDLTHILENRISLKEALIKK